MTDFRWLYWVAAGLLSLGFMALMITMGVQ